MNLSGCQRAIRSTLKRWTGWPQKAVGLPEKEKPLTSPIHEIVAEASEVVAVLRRAYWDERNVLVLTGWAYLKRASESEERVSLALINLGTGQTIELKNSAPPSPEPNRFTVSATRSLAHTFWSVAIPPEALSDGPTPQGARQWQLVATVAAADQRVTTSLTRQYRWGSAGRFLAENFNGVLITPIWKKVSGLIVEVRKPDLVVSSMTRDHSRLSLHLSKPADFEPVTAEWSGAEPPPAILRLTLENSTAHTPSSAATVHVTQANMYEPRFGNWSITLRDRNGSGRLLHWLGPARGQRCSLASSGALIVNGPSGVLRVARLNSEVLITEVTVESQLNELVVRGSNNSSAYPVSAILRGSRAAVVASEVVPNDSASEFSALFTLDSPGWDGTKRTVASGGYRLWLVFDDDQEVEAQVSVRLVEELPRQDDGPDVNLRFERDPQGRFYIDISPPLCENEIGAFNQKRLSMLARPSEKKLSGVLLESWFGKTFSDNPAALVRELRQRLPSQLISVGVADKSVAVPSDTEPLVVGSRRWWDALSTSQFVINNCWFPQYAVKSPGQVWVQTWHGTPLKLLGLDRPERATNERIALKFEADTNTWDILLSQNPYSTEIFRRAYRFHGKIVESGYPRNDILLSADADLLRRSIREDLGIQDGQRVVLYAPTWREGDKGSVGTLEPAELAEALGSQFLILVRGHSVALRRGSNVAATGIIDVTSYPEPAELMLAADCLVTDYSSIMFDFSNLERPIFFYVPDYEEYTSGSRGTYFDLTAKAPGPIIHTLADLADAIRSNSQECEEQRSQWRAEFNPYDDGLAAQRAVNAMLDFGFDR